MLIPAHAGVILSQLIGSLGFPAYPRACGGDPQPEPDSDSDSILSPRMRG